MVRTTPRRARVQHRCNCGHVIQPGVVYLEHVASPLHDDLGNHGWWRLPECSACATRYGRGALLVLGDMPDG